MQKDLFQNVCGILYSWITIFDASMWTNSYSFLFTYSTFFLLLGSLWSLTDSSMFETGVDVDFCELKKQF